MASMGRYDRDFHLKFNTQGGPFSQPEPVQHDNDPLERILRIASGVAPAAGTLIGGGLGAALGSAAGGVGALPGAALGASLGGAAGTGLGALGTGVADSMAEPKQQAEQDRVARENERRARAQAALSMLGGM